MVELAFNENPQIGDPDAPVQLIIFTDFECTYCSQLAADLDEIKDDYLEKKQLRIQIWDYPLEKHEKAFDAAKCAFCADQQGAYWNMYELLYAYQGQLSDSVFIKLANQLNLDESDFRLCMQGEESAAKVHADITSGTEIGVSGTPAFILNGQLYSGAPPKDILIEFIDKQLGLQ